MFKSIRIKHLRAISELEIDNFGQVNLFVGQNNCGKTTILEALFFIAGATNPSLPCTANVMRSLAIISNDLWYSFFHDMEAKIPIEITSTGYDSADKQSLTIKIRYEHTTRLPAEDITSVKRDNGGLISPFAANGLELEYVNSSSPEKVIKSSVYRQEDDIVREGYQEPLLKVVFLSSMLDHDLKDRFASAQRKKKISDIINYLQAIEPKITDLRLNEIGLLEADIGLANLIPVRLMGGGMIRFLSIILTMLEVQNGILLIDEIENALHHTTQNLLWDVIFTLAEKLNIQLFATTHSYECIKAFANYAQGGSFGQQAKLYRIERENNKFVSREFTTDKIARFMENMWEIR